MDLGAISQYLQISVMHHTNKLKNKNRVIISTDAEKKTFDKIQHPLMIKNSLNGAHRRNPCQHNKSHI